MAKTVLVVDDALAIRNLAKDTLVKGGYTVVEAEDGELGLKAVHEHKPDLVLSDLNMPHMNGLEMAIKIKGDPATKDIPIIMLTTEASQDVALKGKEIGVRAWLVKPFIPDKLLLSVKKIIGE